LKIVLRGSGRNCVKIAGGLLSVWCLVALKAAKWCFMGSLLPTRGSPEGILSGIFRQFLSEV
jgi:hypothetical protein